MSDEVHRLLSHGGRMRAKEVEPLIRSMGFEKAMVLVAQNILERQATLHQELIAVTRFINQQTEVLASLAQVLSIQKDAIDKLRSTDIGEQVSNIHPDEIN